MKPPPLQITGVRTTPDGLEISYVRVPADVRKNGLVWQHQVLVPHASDYDDEIENAMEALLALLQDALDDYDRAEPIELEEDEDDDNE